jgi:hypothetical protein
VDVVIERGNSAGKSALVGLGVVVPVRIEDDDFGLIAAYGVDDLILYG